MPRNWLAVWIPGHRAILLAHENCPKSNVFQENFLEKYFFKTPKIRGANATKTLPDILFKPSTARFLETLGFLRKIFNYFRTPPYLDLVTTGEAETLGKNRKFFKYFRFI